MNITQSFYDKMATQYDKLFLDWQSTVREQAAILEEKPPYSPPYIHKTDQGQRVSFQTWDWSGDNYRLTQYIIDDEESLQISKFECEYRATRREEFTKLFLANGCCDVVWKFPEGTDFYQPIVIAKKIKHPVFKESIKIYKEVNYENH